MLSACQTGDSHIDTKMDRAQSDQILPVGSGGVCRTIRHVVLWIGDIRYFLELV